MERLSLVDGAVVETVGAEILILLPGSTETVRLAGKAADVVRRIQSGEVVLASEESTALLMKGGIVTIPPGVSRRGFLRAGALGVGAGMSVLALPTAALASSTIPLEGVWFVLGSPATAYFLINGYDFPDVGDSDETPPGAPAPGNLRFGDEEYSVSSWRSSEDTTLDGDFVLWSTTESDFDWTAFVGSALTLSATFRWAGQSYSGTFVYSPV